MPCSVSYPGVKRRCMSTPTGHQPSRPATITDRQLSAIPSRFCPSRQLSFQPGSTPQHRRHGCGLHRFAPAIRLPGTATFPANTTSTTSDTLCQETRAISAMLLSSGAIAPNNNRAETSYLRSAIRGSVQLSQSSLDGDAILHSVTRVMLRP
ncbi:uncharacterized protein LY79DRAFT_408476 [Colletotrichum navitas]|uniref:Uncharacterized protein n=1 Tax=Colletotrichum navitas TaxID=681940 RepID=A0AAD8Q916_9PEZI|nr:uncharacterized protein LY79DRAFT_408476 [Colletotrichum navitas]KAK1597222.1 hypothetical protein LY79DRAFT_408476 [Colletotrichum navitas]